PGRFVTGSGTSTSPVSRRHCATLRRVRSEPLRTPAGATSSTDSLGYGIAASEAAACPCPQPETRDRSSAEARSIPPALRIQFRFTTSPPRRFGGQQAGNHLGQRLKFHGLCQDLVDLPLR